MAWALLTPILILVVGAVFSGWYFSAPGHRGPPSDHFDGERFRNQDFKGQSFTDFLKWQWTKVQAPWREPFDAPPGPRPPERVGAGQLRVTWVNHATVLIQMDGLNFLTDPIWAERASPVAFAGPRRVRPPGLRFEDLPPIDAVLVSHNHYDHLDLPTLRRLASTHHPRVFSALGNKALLDAEGIAPTAELDWWQSAELAPGVTLTSVPMQHFSSRGLTDRDKTLWTGFVVRGPAGAVLFAGDTGFGPHFAQIKERFGPVRLALLPIGAYLPAWFMSHIHMSPADAVEAHRLLGARTSVAMHFGTFKLADDGEEQPVEELRAALARTTPEPRFWILGFGEGRDVP